MSNKIVFLLLLVFIGCTRKPMQSSFKQPTRLFRTSELIVDNLSEDITGNDELQLIIFQIKDSVSTPILVNVWQDTLIFNKQSKENIKPVLFQLTILDSNSATSKLLILLLEIDTHRSPNKRLELVNTVLSNENYENKDSLGVKIEMAIKDDDLLGIKVLKFSAMKEKGMGVIVFSGIHLFDKYHYRLIYQLE